MYDKSSNGKAKHKSNSLTNVFEVYDKLHFQIFTVYFLWIEVRHDINFIHIANFTEYDCWIAKKILAIRSVKF